MMPQPRVKSSIGAIVRLKGDHPHAGETGTIMRCEKTLAGTGYVVRLDACQHGTEECFLFHLRHADRIG